MTPDLQLGSSTLEFALVDVFADVPLTGNPLAVLFADPDPGRRTRER